ncbi:insulinase family protein [Candidatus Woesearchaeota archaeon]|nr:insulinase family protein [Candidatus Woesearchaeota archaeon]
MKAQFYRKILDNGMTIFLEKRELPIVSVIFAVRNGGINEKPEEKGISHFIEHMLYKGTPKRNAKQIAEEIEKKGGELNGFTDEIVTAYWSRIPSKHLDTALDVLGDMIKNPLFNKEELEKERKVIFEEIKMRKDNPQIYVMDSIQKYLYSGTLGLNLIGSYKTMNSITREDLIKRFNLVYQPNNLILGVVGDADFDKIVNFAENFFGKNKGKIPKIPFSKMNRSFIEKRKGVDQANLIFAYHTPLANSFESYVAQILNYLMAVGMSSRLFSEIREKRNLAYSIKGESNINKFFSYNTIYVGTKKENVNQVKSLILKEFENIQKSLTEKELNQTKEQILGNYYLSSEDSQTHLFNLLSYELDGDSRNFYEFEENIKKIKVKDVKKLSKIKEYSFFALIPEG